MPPQLKLPGVLCTLVHLVTIGADDHIFICSCRNGKDRFKFINEIKQFFLYGYLNLDIQNSSQRESKKVHGRISPSRGSKIRLTAAFHSPLSKAAPTL